MTDVSWDEQNFFSNEPNAAAHANSCNRRRLTIWAGVTLSSSNSNLEGDVFVRNLCWGVFLRVRAALVKGR
jgi:hypothetical protein